MIYTADVDGMAAHCSAGPEGRRTTEARRYVIGMEINELAKASTMFHVPHTVSSSVVQLLWVGTPPSDYLWWIRNHLYERCALVLVFRRASVANLVSVLR